MYHHSETSLHQRNSFYMDYRLVTIKCEDHPLYKYLIWMKWMRSPSQSKDTCFYCGNFVTQNLFQLFL